MSALDNINITEEQRHILISCKIIYDGRATGFFYKINNNVCIVTNKHVIGYERENDCSFKDPLFSPRHVKIQYKSIMFHENNFYHVDNEKVIDVTNDNLVLCQGKGIENDLCMILCNDIHDVICLDNKNINSQTINLQHGCLYPHITMKGFPQIIMKGFPLDLKYPCNREGILETNLFENEKIHIGNIMSIPGYSGSSVFTKNEMINKNMCIGINAGQLPTKDNYGKDDYDMQRSVIVKSHKLLEMEKYITTEITNSGNKY